jgi:transposase
MNFAADGWTDGAPMHRSRAIKTFLAEGAAKRLRLKQLPGYAPDLNPDEGIWAYLKYVQLRNVCCTDLNDLLQHLHLATARLRHKRGMSSAVGLPCWIHRLQ